MTHTHTTYTVYATNRATGQTIDGTRADNLNEEEARRYMEKLGTGEGYTVQAWKNTHTPYTLDTAEDRQEIARKVWAAEAIYSPHP